MPASQASVMVDALLHESITADIGLSCVVVSLLAVLALPLGGAALGLTDFPPIDACKE